MSAPRAIVAPTLIPVGPQPVELERKRQAPSGPRRPLGDRQRPAARRPVGRRDERERPQRGTCARRQRPAAGDEPQPVDSPAVHAQRCRGRAHAGREAEADGADAARAGAEPHARDQAPAAQRGRGRRRGRARLNERPSSLQAGTVRSPSWCRTVGRMSTTRPAHPRAAPGPCRARTRFAPAGCPPGGWPRTARPAAAGHGPWSRGRSSSNG